MQTVKEDELDDTYETKDSRRDKLSNDLMRSMTNDKLNLSPKPQQLRYYVEEDSSLNGRPKPKQTLKYQN